MRCGCCVVLRKRLISKLLVENGVLVKYSNFVNNRRIVGNPVSTAKVLADQVVDEFMVVDLGTIDPDLVRDMVIETMTPVTAAGSIRTMDHVERLIQHGGADKVVIKDIPLAEKVAARFGKQAVVWAIDYTGECSPFVPDCAGEVVVTSIDRDGTYRGYDLAALAHDWKVPVVIAGGCGKLKHVSDAMDAGADGCAISSMTAFTDKSFIKIRSWLRSSGQNVRAA